MSKKNQTGLVRDLGDKLTPNLTVLDWKGKTYELAGMAIEGLKVVPFGDDCGDLGIVEQTIPMDETITVRLDLQRRVTVF